MNERSLVQWVRGELPSDERRQVTEWMIRCRDPQLPLLLDGIMQAERDAERDQNLLGLGPAWTQLVQGWQSLVEQGRAVLLDAPAGDFAMASAQEQLPVLQLVEREEERLAILVAPTPGHFSLIISSDSGHVELLEQASLQAQEQLQVTMGAVGQRSTIWALSGAAGPKLSPIEQLSDALSASEATSVLSAVRLDPREE